MVAGLRDEPLFAFFSRSFSAVSGASAASGTSDEDEAGVS